MDKLYHYTPSACYYCYSDQDDSLVFEEPCDTSFVIRHIYEHGTPVLENWGFICDYEGDIYIEFVSGDIQKWRKLSITNQTQALGTELTELSDIELIVHTLDKPQ